MGDGLELLSDIIGWTYFIAWSLSFYPQAILNFRRKRVDGFSIDFATLNFIAFACYSLYTINLLWNPDIRADYRMRHGGKDNSVMPNDAAFAIHAFILSGVTLAQTHYYPRAPGQKVSEYHQGVIGVFFLLATMDAFLVLLRVQPGLDFLYHLSYFKLYVSIAKYIPQAYLNYKRKSTVGLSIYQMLLDFTGGLLSFIQTLLVARITHDWSSVAGNPVKLGLSVLSILFPSVFIIQHYVIYRDAKEEDAVEPVEDERTPLLA